MDFCVIIPDRGDRKEFTDHCIFQIKRQTIQPVEVFHIDYKPRSNDVDIIERIRHGIFLAKKQCFDYAYIIENDDYYPDNYFESMSFKGSDFVGINSTIYYNIHYGLYRKIYHPLRSSLFCTGFKISGLKDFTWPEDNTVYLDKALWHFAWHRKTKPNRWILYSPENMPIGIKHGIGKCGGIYHTTGLGKYNNQDNDFKWLSQNIRPESLEFYKRIRQTLSS